MENISQKMETPVLTEQTFKNIGDFFGISLPTHIVEGLHEKSLVRKADKQEIMQCIDFTPPFLRIEKMVLLKQREEERASYSIGMGRITLEDTEGHYNQTIYLAFCGKLMGMAASVHLGLLYPHTAPQVVEVGRIIPTEKDIWKPSPQGNTFLVEAVIVRQKLHLAVMEVKISFGSLIMGVVNNLKLVLTPKNSILSAKELPFS